MALGMLAVQVCAQTYTILHSFGTNVMGQYPHSSLVQGPDGTLYGTTSAGGIANKGQVFKVNPDGTGYTILKNFTGGNGDYPETGVTLSDTTLYGTTAGGGDNDNGIVFKLNTDGTGFAVICQFADWVNGAYPGGLILSGTTLYGTTTGGGFGYGTLFKVDVDGSGFSLLKRFTADEGAFPFGPLVLRGAELFGTTESGGRGYGTIFKINTDGSGFAVLNNFVSPDGAGPRSGLVLAGSSLYGTTTWDGRSGSGTLFKINVDGTGFTVLKHFDYGEAYDQKSDLVLLGQTLFGVSTYGGDWGWGKIFKINTDGSDFAVVKEFTDEAQGRNPFGALMLSGSTFYATASEGGFGFGTVFKLESDGSGFTVLTNFVGGDGAIPGGGLVTDGGVMYGTALGGGSSGHGTLFRVNLDGGGYQPIKDFTNRLEGMEPSGILVLDNSTLYGTGGIGGSNDCGVAFKLNTDGSGYQVLKHFGGTDGIGPRGGLLLVGTTLYGTTLGGGSNGLGTVFRMQINGSDFSVMKDFNGSDGAEPQARLLLVGSDLFGTTASGGNGGRGTIFKLNTNGGDFEVLKHFSGSDGEYPSAALTLVDSTLYGLAWAGGISGNGTLFKLNTDGSGFVVIRHFAGASEGANPQMELLLSGTMLYGTTTWAGIGGYGTLFRVETDGSGYSILKHFAFTDGSSPQGVLNLVGTSIYGTASNGGELDSGVLYTLSVLPGPPEIQMQPESQRVAYDGSALLMVLTGGLPAPAYQWWLNGSPLVDATNYSLTFTNFRPSDAGDYFVVVTNSYGSVTSAVASVYIRDPFVEGWTRNAVVLAGNAAEFGVEAGGSSPLSFRWYRNGTALNDGDNVLGSQSATLALSEVTGADSGNYYCIVTNQNGVATGPVNILLVRDPFLNVQPDSRIADAGTTVVLDSEAGGSTPTSYQWFKEGVGLNDGGNIWGAQTPMLTLSNVLAIDAGKYSLIASNAYGSLSNLITSLTVADPFISSQDNSQAVSKGQTVQLRVSAIGTTPLSYQWYRNGVSLDDGGNVAGAHTATLTVSSVTNPDAAGYCVVVANAYGSVTSHVARLYGLSVNPPGYSILYNFTGGGGGSGPWSGAVLDGNTLYGTTCYGGDTNLGTVFKVKLDGSGFTILHRFNGVDGARPQARLLIAETNLYGTTAEGGSEYAPGGWNGNGTIFKLHTDGSGYTVLKSFNEYSDGRQPQAGLVIAGGTLYGTTAGGGDSGGGTVFKINTDGSDFGVLRSFENFSGTCPWGGLVLSGEIIYGTARSNGRIETNGQVFTGSGVVFSLKTNGQDYTVLRTFNGADGREVLGDLLLSGNVLYGTAAGGGTWGYGSIFKICTDGSGFTVLKNFSSGDGEDPGGGLLLANNILYGTTWNGGVSGQYPGGTLFKVNLDGSGFAVLRNFGGDDGGGPTPSLVLSGTNLYGMAFTRGSSNCGVVFSFALPLVPALLTSPLSQTAEQGSAICFSALASGSPPLSYQWLFNGGILSGYTNRLMCLATLQPGDYTVVVSNLAGSVTSAPAQLTVIPPVEHRPVPALNVTGEIGSLLTLDYANELAATSTWSALDSFRLASNSEVHFDLTMPLPMHRFYRAGQTSPATNPPSLGLNMIPVLTLTGAFGDKIRLDGINQFGPTDAWFTLDTVTLTNTSQLYFDISAPGQPARLYRVVPVP